MVNDVEFGNVVHEMLATEPELAINCCRSAFQERPSLGLVFGNVGMRVVEVGYGHDPVIHPDVRHHV